MDLSRFSDPIEQLQWVIDTQGLTSIDKERLAVIKTGFTVQQTRNEELMKEKESKILDLEFQLKQLSDRNKENEGFEKEVVILQLRGENDRLLKLNADLATTVEQGSGIIQDFMGRINNLEKQVKAAKSINRGLEGTLDGMRRRQRIMALKLLPVVMELDSDVAVPGRQRTFDEKQAAFSQPTSQSSSESSTPSTSVSDPSTSTSATTKETEQEPRAIIEASTVSGATCALNDNGEDVAMGENGDIQGTVFVRKASQPFPLSMTTADQVIALEKATSEACAVRQFKHDQLIALEKQARGARLMRYLKLPFFFQLPDSMIRMGGTQRNYHENECTGAGMRLA